MKCTPLKNPWAAQLKERIIEGKNKESSCHRASRNVFFLIKKISIHLPKWYRLVVTAFISLHPKVSKPKFHPLQHLSSSPPQAGTYFPILWSVFLCCCRLQTDTFASMMISKVVVPVTLILVTSLHLFLLCRTIVSRGARGRLVHSHQESFYGSVGGRPSTMLASSTQSLWGSWE